MAALTIYDSFKDEIEKSLKDGLLKVSLPSLPDIIPIIYDWKQLSIDIFSQGNCTDPGLSAILKGEDPAHPEDEALEFGDIDDTPQPAPDFSADPGRVRAFACMEEVKCPGNWEMRFDGESEEWIFTLPLWNDTLSFVLTVDQVEYFSFNPETIASILAFNAEEQIKAWEERQGKRW